MVPEVTFCSPMTFFSPPQGESLKTNHVSKSAIFPSHEIRPLLVFKLSDVAGVGDERGRNCAKFDLIWSDIKKFRLDMDAVTLTEVKV